MRQPQTSGDLLTQALLDLASRLEQTASEKNETPSDWLEKYFYVPEPKDPETGEIYPPGPIRLASHQKRIVNEALRTENNLFKYATIIYSAPKKSGKSALSSGVGLYMGNRYDFAQIYCLANDGKQADDRLYGPIVTCFDLHERLNGPFKDKVKYTLLGATLPNRTKIEPLPCDAAGNAGSEPTMTLWSEIWGFDTESKMRLWSEMTIPPTRWGRALRWVESYAGFMGQSDLLWNIYKMAKEEGEPHPDFLDLVDRDGNPVVWVNEQAKMFCYWDTMPRMIWQTEDYYVSEAKQLTPSEFRRIHQNEWVSPVGSYIDPAWWDACQDETLLPLKEGSRVPAVVGVDAAISGDCAALVLVTRDPLHPDTDVAVRACKIFKPGKRGINLEATIGKTIREWGKKYNIVCIAYDAYQMEKLAQDYRRGLVSIPEEEIQHLGPEEQKAYIEVEKKAARSWYYKFGQQNARAVADKRLYDMILHRHIHWNPNDHTMIPERGTEESLTKHIKQAGAKDTKDKMLRMEKLSQDTKIDAAVALSMAVDRCMTLNIDNKELDRGWLLEDLRLGKISLDEFNERMSEINLKMRVRND